MRAIIRLEITNTIATVTRNGGLVALLNRVM